MTTTAPWARRPATTQRPPSSNKRQVTAGRGCLAGCPLILHYCSTARLLHYYYTTALRYHMTTRLHYYTSCLAPSLNGRQRLTEAVTYYDTTTLQHYYYTTTRLLLLNHIPPQQATAGRGCLRGWDLRARALAALPAGRLRRSRGALPATPFSGLVVLASLVLYCRVLSYIVVCCPTT